MVYDDGFQTTEANKNTLEWLRTCDGGNPRVQLVFKGGDLPGEGACSKLLCTGPIYTTETCLANWGTVHSFWLILIVQKCVFTVPESSWLFTTQLYTSDWLWLIWLCTAVRDCAWLCLTQYDSLWLCLTPGQIGASDIMCQRLWNISTDLSAKFLKNGEYFKYGQNWNIPLVGTKR